MAPPSIAALHERAQISTRPYWWGGVSSVCGALFFFLATLLQLALLSGTAFAVKNPLLAVQHSGGKNVTIDFPSQKVAYSKWMALDPTLLRTLWEYRVQSANLSIVTSAVITLSFFLLLATVMSLADAFDAHSGHKASKTLLVPSFLFATALVVLDLTFNAGQVTTSAFIYKMWTIDDQTLKSLELSYLMNESRELWMLGMVWFFLAVGMLTSAYLNGRSGMLYSSWTFLSVLISLLAVIGFLSDVARLKWLLSSAALDIALAVLVGFFFLPIWMLWTGIYLLAVRPKDFHEVPVNGDGPPARFVPSAADSAGV